MGCELWKATAVGAAVPFVLVALITSWNRPTNLEVQFRWAARLRPFVPFLSLAFVVLLVATLVLAARCEIEFD